MTALVSELWVYPVKSCAGIAVRRATLTPTGLAHDREWVVVDPRGVFLSQRKHPRMSQITPTLTADALVLEAAGAGSVGVPFATEGPEVAVTVWDDQCRGIDQGDEAAEWLTAYLGTDARLVRATSAHVRLIKPRYHCETTSAAVSFADGFATLLASSASLHALNEVLAVPVPMDRFRPNVVVDGDLIAWEEDTWRSVRIGSAAASVVRPCARCPIPDIDQRTGERGTVVRKALGAIRKGYDRTKPNASLGLFFGQNVAWTTDAIGGDTQLCVGDSVAVVTRAEPNIALA